MVKEIALVERAKRILHAAGARAIKTHGSGLSQGEPDLFCCYPYKGLGLVVVIEMKVPGEKPRALQYAALRRWEKAGAIAFWSDAPETIIETIETEIRKREDSWMTGLTSETPR